jgi:hypothetical protein
MQDNNSSRNAYEVLVEKCERLGGSASEIGTPPAGAPPMSHHLSVPWYAETIELSAAAELDAKQVGYATDASTGKRVPSWKETWMVIGDASADPIVLERDTGKVLIGPHGTGSWMLRPMAPTLQAFFEGLGAWLELRETRFGGSLTDENYVVRSEVIDAIRETIGPIVGTECVERWLGQD